MRQGSAFLPLLAVSAFCFLAGPLTAADCDVFDPFDEDPTDPGSDWELYNPLNALFDTWLEDGWWHTAIPTGVNLDHWSGPDRGIQLRRDDVPEDFTIETRINFLGSGADPDNPTWPPATQAYHAALMVYFSQLDVFYWGFYTNSTLRLERSGINNMCQINPNRQEVSLQIKKVGSLYSFSWRAEDTDNWTVVCTQNVTNATPTQVGLIFKTWANMTQYHVFEFDYFCMSEVVDPPVFSDPGVSPDPYPAYAGSVFRLPMQQYLVKGTPPIKWSLLKGPAGATIDEATGEIEWSPAPADEGKTFSFEVKAENSFGADTEAFDAFVRTALCDPFDDDPVDIGGDWEFYNPLNAQFAHGAEDGWWRVVIPTGINLDHWTPYDRAVQLRTVGMPSDFAIETRINFLGSGADPDNPGAPVNQAYQAALMVYFSRYDVYYWGPYRGTLLMLERSGRNNLCQVNPGLQEVSLQIKKEGSDYTFSYRADDADDWTAVCTQTVTNAVPTQVGLIFKTWASMTLYHVFEFDYFCVKDAADEEPCPCIGEVDCDTPPSIEPPCFDVPDVAWVDMPYIRQLAVGGRPSPVVKVTSGPAMTYDRATRVLSGWTPDKEETVALAIEAMTDVCPQGATAGWTIQVSSPPLDHDDEFDDLPSLNTDFWEFYEPQTGVAYDIVEEDGTNWWRMEVPPLGNAGLNFDHWTAVDRAVQLRHAIEDPGADFLIETRMRLDPATVPPAGDEFHVGLMLYFGPFDILYYGPMQQRTIGGQACNISVERSGTQNVLGGNAPGLLTGSTIGLRIEKKCQWYNFFFRDEEEGDAWRLAGTYRTDTALLNVGLVMKTWGGGLDQTSIFDFDYFDIVEAGVPREIFRRGDVDGNRLITIGDAITLLNHMFIQGPAPKCPDTGDIDDDGAFTIGDAISLLNYQFVSGPPPKDPGPTNCGPDPTTADTLGPCVYDPALCK